MESCFVFCVSKSQNSQPQPAHSRMMVIFFFGVLQQNFRLVVVAPRPCACGLAARAFSHCPVVFLYFHGLSMARCVVRLVLPGAGFCLLLAFPERSQLHAACARASPCFAICSLLTLTPLRQRRRVLFSLVPHPRPAPPLIKPSRPQPPDDGRPGCDPDAGRQAPDAGRRTAIFRAAHCAHFVKKVDLPRLGSH